MKYKFRAYNKEMRKMILLDPLQWPLKVLDEEENWKVMMFTGLLDRHGKEIYEGDICNIGEDGHALPLPVSFCDGGFVVNWNGFHDTPQYSSLSAYCNKVFQNCVEVIGNIYENPELMGGTQKAPDLEGLKNCK